MNKITTTAGLVALGAVSLQAAVYAPPPGSPGADKIWSVSAVLRGFYDDNYTTSPSDFRRDSFGIEVSPSAGLNLVREQTTVGLNYVYSFRWYEDRDEDEYDQSHQVNAKLSHAFTPRYKIDLSDSFVVAQEPSILDPSAVVTVPLRTEGDNIRNVATVSFSAGVAENTDVVLGYSNTFYDYEQDGFNSRSSLLDRVEHLGSVNLRQVILPQTVGVLGYQFEVIDYTSNDQFGLGLNVFDSDVRDNYSHYFYLGVDQSITSALTASIRGGVQYTDYHEADDIPGAQDDEWTPYVDANATYLYMPGSYAQLGVRHARSQIDVGFAPGSTSPIQDSETTTVYGSLNHRFAGSFVASLIGQYQFMDMENNSESFEDHLLLAGVNLTYEINRWVAAEVGYNYDHLDSALSDVGVSRSYTRNRVYVGIRATY